MSVFIFYSIIYRSFIEIFAFFLQSQKDLVLKKLNYLTQLYHNRISHRESVFKSHQFARGLMANLSILGYFFFRIQEFLWQNCICQISLIFPLFYTYLDINQQCISATLWAIICRSKFPWFFNLHIYRSGSLIISFREYIQPDRISHTHTLYVYLKICIFAHFCFKIRFSVYTFCKPLLPNHPNVELQLKKFMKQTLTPPEST